jgi:hypothetical protein
MPLTSKGEEIKSAMTDQYGPEKGKQVFYASRNKGTISGVDAMDAEQQRDERGRFGSGGGRAPPSAAMTSLKMQVERKQQSEAQAKARAAEPPKKAPPSDPMSGEAAKGGEAAKSNAGSSSQSDVGQRLAWFNEDEMISADNAATAKGPDGAQDEPPPQKMLPDQQQPNTVPTESEAASSISPNTIWPGRHV